MRCATHFTFLHRRHHCRKCGGVFCDACSYHRLEVNGYEGKVRVCVQCSCPLLRLSFQLLQYVQSFLDYHRRDIVLRVCRTLQALVILPYPTLDALDQRFSWVEPEDILARSPTTLILRCQDRMTRQVRAVKVIAKTSFYSRGDWQSLQHSLDILSSVNHPALPNLFDVCQTARNVVVVMELIPKSYIPLSHFVVQQQQQSSSSITTSSNNNNNNNLSSNTIRSSSGVTVCEQQSVALKRSSSSLRHQFGSSTSTSLNDSRDGGVNDDHEKKSNKKNPFEDVAVHIMFSLLDAVSYMHKQGVIHRNLNPEEVLVDPASLTVKIPSIKFAKRCGTTSQHQRSSSILSSTLNGIGAFRRPPQQTGVMFKSSFSSWTVVGSPLGADPTAASSRITTSQHPSAATPASGGQSSSSTTASTTAAASSFSGTTSSSSPSSASSVGYGTPAQTFLYLRAAKIPRPPPIRIQVDDELHRKSQLYSRNARSRVGYQAVELAKAQDFAVPPPAIVHSMLSADVTVCASPRGIPRFVAPEVVELYASRNALTHLRLSLTDLSKWDVFACGILFYFLVSGGATPWTSTRWDVLALTMGTTDPLDDMANNLGISLPCATSIRHMLSRGSEHRPTCDDALQSSVFVDDRAAYALSPPAAPTKDRRPRFAVGVFPSDEREE